MTNDTETAHYFVRGTDPANNEQIAFECVGLAAANAKAAELRMGGYRDVILSLVKASETDNPTS
jgi:hypothetical protein